MKNIFEVLGISLDFKSVYIICVIHIISVPLKPGH